MLVTSTATTHADFDVAAFSEAANGSAPRTYDRPTLKERRCRYRGTTYFPFVCDRCPVISSHKLEPVDDSFNYVAVLVSIVLGLGVTRVLSQLSETIQIQNRPRTYWVHTVWMVGLFINLMLSWWVFYRWKTASQWNFFLFVWVTIAPTLLYLGSGVLCPGELESTGAKDWREYFYTNRGGFFFSILPIWPLDIIDTLLKGKQHFIDQGPFYLPTMAIWTAGFAIAGISGNERYHQFWSIFFPLSVIGYITIVLLKLG